MLVTLAAVAVLLSWDRLRAIRMQRRPHPVDEVRLVQTISAELRGGASLRMALAVACEQYPALSAVPGLARSGAPLAQIAPVLGDLPTNGRLLAAAVQVAAVTGGRSIDVFARLGVRASEAAQLSRERRVLTAQARLSAGVVGGLPVLWILVGGRGQITTLLGAGGVGPVVAAVGVLMELAGGLAVWRLARP